MTPQVQTEVKRTRAEVIRDKVQIRLAVDEAGPYIAEILKENDIELPGVDWTRGVFPHWLIATVDDEVIGCVQVSPSKPVAWLEFLFVKPSAPFKFRAIAIKKLIEQGEATAYHGGATYVAGMVDGKNQKFYDVLTKIRYVALSPHVAMLKRVR